MNTICHTQDRSTKVQTLIASNQESAIHSLVMVNDQNIAITTSLRIAEGVGNPHSSVIKLIRNNIKDFQEFGIIGFEIQPKPKGQRGGSATEYAILNEQQATLLMTYMRNTEIVRMFKKRLVKAFFEQGRQKQTHGNFSRLEILQLALEAEQKRLQLEQENQQLETKGAEDAPKVAFHDQVTIAPDAISVAQAAKVIGTGRNRLISFLRKIKWITRKNEPYQAKIEQGLLDVKLGNWEHPDHGLQQSVTALVTGKGLSRLQQLWSETKIHH
ncbi:phage regulatory protein/antirepressor Ant [Photobacterium sp. OFAV2-7]|uniref:phage antirepressor KilAC domain-containing protein n=1 Tax=Photobacterium sp. OFAV2-7 TaxID=2917748 RepID=UPI001EF60987|nr:phage regulatory protein/antirepressor Ant [Photobacterium sp. OFAV2-7]MCG7588008.1 phage regulatory protein/antirepressor Ant [Photobacterium sp. OFAV2-7]